MFEMSSSVVKSGSHIVHILVCYVYRVDAGCIISLQQLLSKIVSKDNLICVHMFTDNDDIKIVCTPPFADSVTEGDIKWDKGINFYSFVIRLWLCFMLIFNT